MSIRSDWKKAKFAEQAAPPSTWEQFHNDAAHERIIMVTEFHTWAIAKRYSVEQDLIRDEHWMIQKAPFAQAGIEHAATPKELPAAVIDFALGALDVIEHKRNLALLNVYYEQQACMRSEQELTVEKGNEAEIAQLWEWFLRERPQAEGEAAGK